MATDARRNPILRTAATVAMITLSPLAMAQGPAPGGGERGAPGAGAPERGGERPGANRPEPGAGRPTPGADRPAPGAERPGVERRESGADRSDRPGTDREPKGSERPRDGTRAPLSGEQRTRFRGVLREQHVEAIHGAEFSIGRGVIVPERYRFYPLPLALIELVPEYRGYDYIVVDDKIIILEPGTRRIVDIIDD